MSADPHQLQHYLQSFPEKTRTKGEAIYRGTQKTSWLHSANIEVLSKGLRSAQLLVPSASDDYSYDVKVSWSKTGVRGHCECLAYEEHGPCKHVVAAVYYLMHESEEAANTPTPKSAPEPKAAPVADFINLAEKLRIIAKPAHFFRQAFYYNNHHRISQAELRKIVSHQKDEQALQWDFVYRQTAKLSFYPRITYDGNETFSLYCSCADFSMCSHLTAAAGFLDEKHGYLYFQQFKNWDAEKRKIIRALGLDPSDAEAKEISFQTDAWGGLEYKVPEWLWPERNIDELLTKAGKTLGLLPLNTKSANPLETAPITEFEPAVVFQTVSKNLPFPFELALINAGGGKFSKVNPNNADKVQEAIGNLPREIGEALYSISTKGLNEEIRKAGGYIQLPNDAKYFNHQPELIQVLKARYHKALQLLWPWLAGMPEHIFTTADIKAPRISCAHAAVYTTPVTPFITVKPAGNFIALRIGWKGEAGIISQELKPVAGLLLHDGHTWYLPAETGDLNLLASFPAGFIKLPKTALDKVLGDMIPRLRQRYEVETDASIRPVQVRPEPRFSLHLAEQGSKHLALLPRAHYGNDSFYYEENPAPLLQRDTHGQWQEIIRDSVAEKAFSESLRALHPLFENSSDALYLLPFAKALEQGWYQNLLALMAERGISVTGIEELKHFRYNAHPARVSVSSSEGSSGIDWFDLNIEISFGDQQVSLKEVRRALMNGQAGVRLDDGTIGLLPDEFVAQYGALLKLGTEGKDGKLRLNKLHFTLIDELHEAALSKDMSAEIAAKKAKLREVENIKTVAPPEAINATLRPYQLSGYNWLQVLDELGWGGCLADDMGLGKTLQTITFLQYLKEKHPGSRHLVICPTSLIYNWQAELEKFAPALRYHIHYGKERVWDEEAIKNFDLVITTYGTVRSDLKALAGTPWHYIILDESQAIKNPEAQTTKAVQALPARNRLCLSGTPLQNNTYDLYAQFQFLNPGLLGSRDFFRTEFANPIDKKGEEGPRATLRKMLAPFMLRRTKGQVAQDLPDKTEIILWCEMEEAQRAVYDEYRRFYRDSLLQRIDAEGMAGAAIYVLEALLRLRQLCDHPALVKNAEVKTSASIKLEELRREILENAGGRKVLVFSQFTEMLGIIAKDFEAAGVKYAYLDGKTPAKDRKKAVEAFQSDDAIQVFLISLKAGGVGLNLTAAEYVYLVDPWWNPAVEAQAIDRTHRIGQTNKVMAYRMICKDTVEEKVMQLQARKRALAEGLVTEDAGFVKKLTRDDVAFLLG